ncbi:tumor necrosis factor ligand superfamily member 15 [Canis lupus baileyi]|uniref:Tumor necrosis factor ligand superfamily member 15 n=1 Tax=Canis lupus familiaris TaxID=9615 RepID=A0A8C0NN74_CANLF|nr:tumor necrosis factor ligand superfamily member 15 [Canis lupus familiaris]XP_853679.3 tumor necrosis factor ligand superfamily member 15 [Canis lupus familiaris]
MHPLLRACLLYNGGSLCPGGVRPVSRTSKSMAENLGLGFRETASVEMLPEEGSCTPKARARLATRSHACWALTCCLVSFPILAGLTTYLLIGQLRAQGDTCVFQAPKGQEFGHSHQRAYASPRAGGDKPRAHLTVVRQSPTQPLESLFPALHWEHELGLAFTKNRMNYTNKFLVIPESGDYFVYSQVTFRGTTSECGEARQGSRLNKPDSIIVVITKVTDSYPEPTQLLMGTKSVCEVGSNWFQPIYLGAMFSLQEGDKLMVNVSDISLVDYTKEDKTFFGAFLL